MRMSHLAVSITVLAVALCGCSGTNAPSVATSTGAISEENTQPVSLLDGRVTLKIPARMEAAVDQGGLYVFNGEDGAITLAGVPAPSGDASALLTQTIDNLKQADSELEILSESNTTIAGKAAKAAEIRTRTAGRDVHLSMVLSVFDGKMVMIQVVGPQEGGSNVSARLKTILGSAQIK